MFPSTPGVDRRVGDVGFGITASGKLTWPPDALHGTNCSSGWDVCDEQDQVVPKNTSPQETLDVALQKRDTGTDLGL